MCGIVGVVARSPVNQLLYDGLTVLQHRGQDAAGHRARPRATASTCTRGGGWCATSSARATCAAWSGTMGIAHCRYPTAGSASSVAESQPFYVNSPFGIVLGHNGNLVNADELRQSLFLEDRRHINTNSDSEVLLNVLAHEIHDACDGGHRLTPDAIFKAVARRAPAREGRLCRGRDDRRLRAARLPRPEGHPPAHHRARRHGEGRGIHRRLRERGAGHPRLQGDARRRPRARRSSSTRAATSTAGSAPSRRRSTRASSSSSTSRGPIR